MTERDLQKIKQKFFFWCLCSKAELWGKNELEAMCKSSWFIHEGGLSDVMWAVMLWLLCCGCATAPSLLSRIAVQLPSASPRLASHLETIPFAPWLRIFCPIHTYRVAEAFQWIFQTLFFLFILHILSSWYIAQSCHRNVDKRDAAAHLTREAAMNCTRSDIHV